MKNKESGAPSEKIHAASPVAVTKKATCINIIHCAGKSFKELLKFYGKDDYMQSILEEFARGNISPEPRSFNRNSHYGRTMKKLSDYETKLFTILGESEKEILRQFIDVQAEISLSSEVDKFMYGYSLGVLMTIEVFEGKDNLMQGGEV